MRGPRVLVAHPYPDVYGADRVLLEAVSGLSEAGMDPTVVLPHAGPMTAWLEGRNIAFRFVPTPVIRRAVLKPRGLLGLVAGTPQAFARIARAIDELSPDVVYVNTITLPHWVLGARRARLPVVVHAHESDARMPRWAATTLAAPLLAADRVIAVSHSGKAFLERAAPRLGPRTVVVYNGLPVPQPGLRPPLERPPARMVVVGRLNPNKGQDLAIAAADLLRNRGRAIRLELVGDTFPGYEHVERHLRESVRELRLEAEVEFSGFSQDVPAVLSATDIVLAPSRTDSLPLSVIEAMLAARPVVASAVGGLPELIQDGVSGLVVPVGNVEALADCVEQLIDDPVLARRLGHQARRRAIEQFGIDRFREEVARVLEAAAGSRTTAAREA